MARSGDLLFDRRCRVTILTPVESSTDFNTVTNERIEIDSGTGQDAAEVGLRIQFKIVKTLKKEPNTSELTITNLSEKTRAKLQKKGVKAIVEVGYRDAGPFRVFAGDVRTVDHVRVDAEWQTKMQLADGERAWRNARVKESFAAGTPASDALRRIGKATGLGLGNLDKQSGRVSAMLDHGWVASGNATKEFDRLIKALRLTWSSQDGEIQILEPDAALDLPIPELTPESGLIGSPEMGSPPTKKKPQLLKYKGLIFATKPGAKVKLKSERYDGYVKTQAVEFEGDTAGGPWYANVNGVLLK